MSAATCDTQPAPPPVDDAPSVARTPLERAQIETMCLALERAGLGIVASIVRSARTREELAKQVTRAHFAADCARRASLNAAAIVAQAQAAAEMAASIFAAGGGS